MTGSPAQGLLSGAGLDDTLLEIAQEAERTLGKVDSAGIAVHAQPGAVLSASSPLAAQVDTAQYRLGHGPCLHAFRSNTVVVLDLDGHDPRWPRFEAAALSFGVRAVLSVPLRLLDQTVGSLNLYSRGERAFAVRESNEAELFTPPAGLRLSPAGVALRVVEVTGLAGLDLRQETTVDTAVAARILASPRKQ